MVLAQRIAPSRLMAASTPLGARAGDIAEVEAIVRASGTSFYRGMAVLPADRRTAMHAIYAFCREVDDIADDVAELTIKRQRLAGWRGRIASLFEGVAVDPITRVLLPAVARFELRRSDFLAVIDGMQMDAEGPIVAPDLATLDLYCDRVASAVGRLSVRAFGDASAHADEVAHALGRALQLTNILRDLHEDAGQGRLYLPREWLDDAQVPHEPKAALRSPGLAAACERVAERAHELFNQARAAMRFCDQGAMRPAILMAATYTAVLERVERRGWQQLEEPVRLPTWAKLWLVLRHGLG